MDAVEIVVSALGLIQGVLAWMDRRCNWILYVMQLAVLFVFSLWHRLYGDAFQCIVMSVICVWAYFKWNSSPIGQMTIRMRLFFVIAIFLATVGAGLFLQETDDPLPFTDAFTTVTSFVALILMAAHKTEAWIVWLLNDISYVYEYFVLPGHAWWLFALYVVWTVMAIGSLVSWNKTYIQKSSR